MANLQKKTKAELIMMCNERGGEIEHLRKEVEKIQEQFNITDKELQALRNKVSERDKTISMQGESYKDLKDSYDELVYKNGVNRSNVGKYKLTTIAFIILFIIALICACI